MIGTSSTAAARPADCVPVAGDRSALHPLHLGHDRHPQGRRARQWRPRRGAALVDAQHLRRRSRTRCSGPPPMSAGWSAIPTSSTRRCSMAAPRSCTRASRSARPMPARSGASSTSTACGVFFTAPTAFRAIKREDPDGRADPRLRSRRIPRAVPGRRARRSADRRLGRGAAPGAGHRPLVADRDRLADRRQLPRHRAAAGEARLVHARRCRAGTCACSTPSGGRRRAEARARSARWRSSCRCRRARCRPCGRPTSASSSPISSAYPGYLPDRRCRVHRRGRLYPRDDPHRRHHQCRRPSPLDRRRSRRCWRRIPMSPNAP